MKSLLLPGLAAALLAGCAHAPGPPLTTADYAADMPAQGVVDLLAIADRAARDGARDAPRLAAALAALDGYGARPAETDGDPVPAWRASLPASAVPPMRGRVLGPAYRKGVLEPGATVRLDQLFDGGRQARVAVATPDEGALGIAVLDGSGKPICPSHLGQRGQCKWVPPYSGRHQIVLSNPGSARSTYYLAID